MAEQATDTPMTDVYDAALDEWGDELQVDKSIEELSELIQELSRWHLGYSNEEDIHEELADVEIMCQQLRRVFDQDRIDAHREQKIARLWDRIEQ